MPSETQILPIGGKRSALGWGGSQVKLRRLTALGLGEQGSFQHQVNRLFRTQPEGERAPVRVEHIEDVTRGLGLDSTDEDKIQDLILETNVSFAISPKDRRPKILDARRRLSSFLQATKRIGSEQRMEITKRALAWWRANGKPDYQGKPMIRFVARKSLSKAMSGHKYLSRMPNKYGGFDYKYKRKVRVQTMGLHAGHRVTAEELSPTGQYVGSAYGAHNSSGVFEVQSDGHPEAEHAAHDTYRELVRKSLSKAMAGAEAAGHKYKKRIPKPGGGFRYIYTDLPKYKMRVTGEKHEEVAKQISQGIERSADLCKVNPPVCVGNLGIDRKDMPQLSDEVIPHFLKSYQDKGTSVTKGTEEVGRLKATQGEINAEKVMGMVQAYKDGKFNPADAPIIVSRDGYVLDGHHRWAALLVADPSNRMKIYRVDTPIQTLLADAKGFKGVTQAGFGAPSAPPSKKTVGDADDDADVAAGRHLDADEKPHVRDAHKAAWLWWNLRKAVKEDDWAGEDADFDYITPEKVPDKKPKPKGKSKGKGKDVDDESESEDGESGGVRMDVEDHEGGGYKVKFHDDVEADLRDGGDYRHHAREWAKHTAGYHVHKENDPDRAEAHKHAANLHARVANAFHRGKDEQPPPPQGPAGAFDDVDEPAPGVDALGNDVSSKPDKKRNMPSRDTQNDAQRANTQKKKAPVAKSMLVFQPRREDLVTW